MSELLKNAGPFAFVNVAAAAVGLLLALVTLATGKSSTGKVLGILALLLTLAVLGIGFGGYFLGMTGTHAALPNVPDDQRELLLRKGTEESRGNFVIALAAALLPLLAGFVSAVRNGSRPGVLLGALAVLVSATMGVQLASPLPPEGPPFVEPPGLTLAQSSWPRGLRGAALVALTPDGLWANGARVGSFADALAEPLVQERNRGIVPVLVDARVKFSALADLVEAGDKAGRSLQLVVASPTGEHQVISVFGRSQEPPGKDGKPALALTVRVGAKAIEIGAVGGSLDPLPADPKALNDRLCEVKAAFPDVDLIRFTAEHELPFSELVRALDATVTPQQNLLFPTLIVGRFELSPPAADTAKIGE